MLAVNCEKRIQDPFLQRRAALWDRASPSLPGGRSPLHLPDVLGHVLRVHEDGKEAVDVPLELLVAF